MGHRVIERRVHGIRVSGSAAHETLRRALRYAVEGKPVNLTHVRTAFFEEVDRACEAEGVKRTDLHWRRDAKPDDHYRIKIAALYQFLVVAPKMIAKVECVETKFHVALQAGTRVVHVAGTWDIVFRTHQDKLALGDYKTGASRPTAFTRNFGYQLGLYAHAMLEGKGVEEMGHGSEVGGAVSGREVTFGKWPDEIWIIMTQDFLPMRRDSNRKVWEPEEAEHFRCRRGETVRIRKGQQKGPGWYKAERSPEEMAGLGQAVWSIVATVRAGQFPRRFDDDCSRCEFKGPCVQEAMGMGEKDMSASEKRRLEAALADIPLDELDGGFGDVEP